MRTLTPQEFKKLYGDGALNSFSAPQATQNQFFNVGAAADVFKQAGQDVALAQQFQRDQKNSLSSTFRTGGTMFLQGATAPLRAAAAGVLGTETGQQASASAVSGLTAVGDVITPDSVKKKVGQTALDVIKGYEEANPQKQLDQRNKLAVAEVLSYFLGGEAVKGAVVQPAVRATETAISSAKSISKQSDEVLKQGAKLRETIQTYVGSKSVEPQVQASAERLVAQGDSAFLKGTAERTEDVLTKYNRYLAQSEQAINDIKVDPAISEVGSRMGDSFNDVVAQRRAVGAVLGDELKAWGKLRVSVTESVDNLLNELSESGLSYNPRTRQLTSFQGSKFTPEEVAMLNDFVARMKLLGNSPTVKQIDDFVARTRTSMEFTKGKTGVMGTTNAERIIDGGLANLKESLNPAKNGIQQLDEYWKANKTYSELSDFVKEGSQYLGKLTQSGDFAKDASIAKSAVQSILNNGKKDWILKLEALTGYNALDDAVLALQAMKDAGDFRGLSLLQAVKDQGIPTSKAGITGAIIDNAVDLGKRVVAGTPADQTRAFLKSLQKVSKKVDLKTPSKKIVAGKNVPKTKAIIKTEKDIAKNVEAQKKAIKAGDFTLVATLKEVYETLVAKLKELIKEVVEAQKNPQTGQKGSVDFFAPLPKKVSKIVADMTEEDAAILRKIVDNKYDRTPIQTNRTLKEMGMEKLSYGEQKELAAKILKGYDERWGGIDEVGVATTRPGALDIKKPNSSLMEEAKVKYNTVGLQDKYPELAEAMYRLPEEITVYRGTGKGIGNATFVKGEYWADSEKFAKTFGNITDETLPKNTAIFDFDVIKNNPDQSIVPKQLLVDQEKLTDYLVDRGIEYTKNTNTRGVEYVKLNKAESLLRRKAQEMSASKFKEHVLDNYDEYRSELARITKNYTQADISRLRDPIEDIWKQANRTASADGK